MQLSSHEFLWGQTYCFVPPPTTSEPESLHFGEPQGIAQLACVGVEIKNLTHWLGDK